MNTRPKWHVRVGVVLQMGRRIDGELYHSFVRSIGPTVFSICLSALNRPPLRFPANTACPCSRTQGILPWPSRGHRDYTGRSVNLDPTITVSWSTSHCSPRWWCDGSGWFAVSRPTRQAPTAVSCGPARWLPLIVRSSPRCRCSRWSDRKSDRTLVSASRTPSRVSPGSHRTETFIGDGRYTGK